MRLLQIKAKTSADNTNGDLDNSNYSKNRINNCFYMKVKWIHGSLIRFFNSTDENLKTCETERNGQQKEATKNCEGAVPRKP